MSGIPTLKGVMGKLAQDGRRGHMQTPYAFGVRYAFTGTAATHVICTIPAYATYGRVFAEVLTAFNGTTPTLTIGTYDEDGAVDDADELVDSNDIDLTSTGLTTVADKWGVLTTSPRLLVATFAAAAAPSAGEVLIAGSFIPLTKHDQVALS